MNYRDLKTIQTLINKAVKLDRYDIAVQLKNARNLTLQLLIDKEIKRIEKEINK